MAIKKTAAKTTAPKTAPKTDDAKNTSAPLSETPAEVLAPAAEQSAAPATSQAVVADPTLPEKTSGSPSRGKETSEPKAVIADPVGAALPVVAQALIVRSKVPGFRRAGRAWGTEAETVDCAEFTDAQVEALLSEPLLDVVVVAD